MTILMSREGKTRKWKVTLESRRSVMYQPIYTIKLTLDNKPLLGGTNLPRRNQEDKVRAVTRFNTVVENLRRMYGD